MREVARVAWFVVRLVGVVAAELVRAIRDFCWSVAYGSSFFRLGYGMKIGMYAVPLRIVERKNGPKLVRARVSGRDGDTLYAVPEDHAYIGDYVNLDEEGIAWCRGWKGEQVAALRAAKALS